MTSMIGSSALNVIADGFQRAILSLVLLLSMTGFVVAQETAAADADKAAATTEEGAESADPVAAENIPAPDASEEDDASTEDESVIPGFILLAIVIALFVVPMFVGSSLAKSLKMPDHGWKFSLGLGTLAAAAVVISQGEVKFGPDLSGGITLIYELQDTSAQPDEGNPAEDQEDQSTSAKQRLVRQLIGALTERVDPSGTKEVTIREYGLGQIEIIIPKASQQELDFIERRIYTAGALEFRITASPVFEEHRQIIELAKLLPPGENEVHLGDKKVAEWMAYDVDKFGPAEHLVTRTAGSVPQALIMMNDELNVTGEFLKKASSDFDEQGRPQVSFNFNPIGAFRFGRLTGKHVPNPSGQEYHLGIILDKKLLSAPSIKSKITDQGRITGGMGKEEVDFIVSILNAGSLPATLNKDPISREQISPTLGAETVEMGRTAILYSLIAVMIFMVIYYRFAGVVACVALAANLLLILGLMVLFKAAFTLPGLAGLVLTIGMSVDANVLIFERIREERNRGAALRMAIRNGFARATQTIVDANVTTLITAIVIYKIAPDNVKGFGVMLIIGIVMSMYTAIFLSRIIFDVAEKTRKISELGMAQIIGKTNFNFLNKAIIASILSAVLITIGIVAVSQRGKDLLNIDFTGGSSVTLVLNDDAKMSFSEVKSLLDETELKDKNLSLVEVGDTQTQYKVSSVNQDVEAVQEILHKTFGDKLKTYHVELQDVTSLTSQAGPVGPVVHLVNFQEEAKGDAEEETADKPVEEEPVEEEPASVEETPADEPLVDPFAGGTSAKLVFNMGEGQEEDAGISYDSAAQLVRDALEATGHSGTAMAISNPDYQVGSVRRFSEWEVKLALPENEANQVFAQLETVTNSQPIFPLANKIGGRVAGDMKTKAIAAIVISLVGIVAYIWFRFQHVMYGLAAVVALVHDVLVTLGMIALSAFLVDSIPGLADALLIEKFQISLPIVAAFLTIIGYSLNDTIVVFDRIREVKGKSPNLTSETINTSINQTLGRTLLTSLTTLLSVILLYVLGGDGIHGFAFSLVVGVIVGTYSSIFIASPVLLWMSQRGQEATTNSGAKAA